MKNVILVDIDNCFCDSRKWIDELPKDRIVTSREEWDEFLKKITLCEPNTHFIETILEYMDTNDCVPIFVTSRENRFDNHNITIQQIESFSEGELKINENCFLFMRKENDMRPCSEVKRDLIEGILKIVDISNIHFAIDDSEENCKSFKSFGIKTFLYNIESNLYINY